MTGRYLTAARLQELDRQLIGRDLLVLQFVSELRFVSGAQLTRLGFADLGDSPMQARAARRALLRLTRLGLLERLPRQVGGARAGSAGYVYRLGVAGQRLAMVRGWQPERRGRRSLVPGSLFVAHALQVAELHTRLIEADRSRRFELLELCAEPSCWRNYDGAGRQRQTLKPDSYARLGVGDFEHSYFLEVDRGTEGSRALTSQLSRYADYFAAGIEQAEQGVFPLVLWLAPDERRAGVIEDCVERLGRAERELFLVAQFTELLTELSATHNAYK